MGAKTDGRDLVDGDRQADYGPPEENMRRIGLAWSAILDTPVGPEQVALCMAALKLVREAHRHKSDNIVDAHGYIEIVDRIAR